MNTTLEIDSSLEDVIRDESLDGRRSLFDDLRTGFHAKLVLGEMEHSKISRRTGTAWGGDGEFREIARMPEASFQYLYHKHGADEMNGDDLLPFHMRHCPEMQTHYVPSKTCVFFPAAQTHHIIQASKYTPARA